MSRANRMARRIARRCVIAFATLICAAALAQGDYPAKPVRLIVPFPPGAGTDNVARYVAQKLGDALRQPVVVENRTGAGGAIGAAEAAKADPDGYTLLFVASPFTTVAASTKDPGYDPVNQFVPVASIASGPLAFVVNVNVPANTLREFIDLAKREPGRLNYGSAGTGSVNHLALELFNARAGVDVVHVPYRGIADATKDLLGGQIQAMTASIPATLPQLAEHKVKVLAVTGRKRIAQMPDVPSWQEQGVADAEVINYWGIVAPKGTPTSIVARLNHEISRILARPEVKARLEREGVEIVSGPPQLLGTLISEDLGNWRKLIEDAKLTFE